MGEGRPVVNGARAPVAGATFTHPTLAFVIRLADRHGLEETGTELVRRFPAAKDRSQSCEPKPKPNPTRPKAT